MKKTVELAVFAGKAPLILEYCETEFSVSENTGVNRYDRYKISFLFTDGIHAVVDDRPLSCAAGDVLFFHPDEIHFGRITRSGIQKYLDLLIPPDFFEVFAAPPKAVTEMLSRPPAGNRLRPRGQEGAELWEEVTALKDRALEGGEGDLGFRALMLICRLAEMGKREERLPPAEALPPCVSVALQYISRHYAEKVTLARIAQEAYCSVTHLTKTFRKTVGCTVGEQLTDYRLAVAKRLLDGGKSVAEVCYECGFGDSSHFIRTFRKKNGITPYEYKKR